jgi:hypothetical protein
MTKFFDRVKMSLTTTGTGVVTFGSVVSGFQSLSDVGAVNGDTVRYTIESGNDFEVGTGTVGVSGSTYTLTRTPSSSSAGGNAAISVTVGAECFLTMLAEDIVQNIADLNDVSSTTPNADQVLSYNSSTNLWTPTSPSGGIASASNYAALPTSPNEKDMVWVTDEKQLYIYDGTEWDRFYTDTNATPDWTTEPPEAAILAKDGTATVQTVVASDPEGFPIEYSYDTNPSNQAQATISQSNNAFTLTPSTNTSNEGSFTIRYRASDGIHSTSRSTVYTLSFYTNPDIANMTYDTGKDFSISSQDGDPQGMWMNPSGTKLFVLGATNDTVYEYNLSTADDVSTASYTNVSLSISGQEAYPTGLCFSPDGYNMYVVGRSSDKVHQYSLTTAYDLSTASYANKEFSVVSQEANPAEVRFNNDGTRMFVVGYSSDHVNQYDLSTAYDVSTASYNNVRFSIGSQEISPYGLHFNPQGTKMYVTGGSTDDVFEYDLTTGFDVSTASYNNVTINLPNYNPRAIFVNDDGTKFYVIANTNPIRRYTCN